VFASGDWWTTTPEPTTATPAVLAIPAFLVAVVAFVQLREGLFELPPACGSVVLPDRGRGRLRLRSVEGIGSRPRLRDGIADARSEAGGSGLRRGPGGRDSFDARPLRGRSLGLVRHECLDPEQRRLCRGVADTHHGSRGDRDSTPTPAPTLVNLSVFQPYATSGPTINPATVRVPNLNRITFLIVGFDFMTGRTHSLTDTDDAGQHRHEDREGGHRQRAARHSNFDLYYGGWVGQTFKLNSLLNAALSPRFHSPDPPMLTLEKEIGYLVGVPVDYYAAIDLAASRR